MADPTPLRSPRGLYALDRAFGNPTTTVRIASRWQTWGQLADAELTELARVTAGRALRAAPTCPELPAFPPDYRPVGRFDPGYPAAAAEMPDAPNVLFVTGTLPAGPSVTIGGGAHPSPAGYRLARRTAELAVARDVVVIAVVSGGCGDAALDAALHAGGRVVAVTPYGVNRLEATNRRLVDEVVRLGGAVISSVDPDHPRSEATVAAASRLAVALGRSLMLAEAGLDPAGGLATATAALELRRYLIVPDHHDPRMASLSSLGSMALSRTDPVSLLGDSPQLRARVAAGKTPADAVVTCDADLDAAVAYGAGVTDCPPPERDPSGWVTLG